MSESLSLLSIEELTVAFPPSRKGGDEIRVVENVSLIVERGETVGVVGESGSGKSMTALSVLRLLPEPGRITKGKLQLGETDLLSLTEKQMRSVRGGKIAMIFQDPMTSLNPVFTVGDQIAESVRLHRGLNKRDSWTEAVQALRRVHISLPERRASQYPYELSGGMRQRVMIALALASEPQVLLADEPTTALDVTVQAQILALLNELKQETGMGILLITHDLGVVAETCDQVIVMYSGQIMEAADTQTLFAHPSHPYTQGLLASLPEMAQEGATELAFIPGQPPVSGQIKEGCPFRTRCPKYMPGTCERPLPTVWLSANHRVRCHLYGEATPV